MNPHGNPTSVSPQTPSLTGVRALVVGLGRFGGGVGVTRWLVQQGADVTVTDQADPESLAESVAAIADLPTTLALGGHGNCSLAEVDLAVINPAVHKNTSGLFQEICHRKIPWTTEINLFCERCPARMIGVTGSFGKSTTSAMLAHVLEAVSGQTQNLADDEPRGFSRRRWSRVHLGGNIGRSLLLDLPSIGPDDIVVLELSNAQLEDVPRIQWNPEIAVVTNLFPHHLDRYENFDQYIQAKLNLVRAGKASCPIVFGELAPRARLLLQEAVGANPARLSPVREFAALELAVPGRHNQINAACTATICEVLELKPETVRQALSSFRGLPHRLELVGEFGGVTYINDSKSTAPAATIIALEALHERQGKLIVIVGGQKKDVPLSECATALANAARIVICYGQAGPTFAAAMPAQTAVQVVADVEAAVALSRRLAHANETVLFSPGAPSFDQYANFADRGKHFTTLVTNKE